MLICLLIYKLSVIDYNLLHENLIGLIKLLLSGQDLLFIEMCLKLLNLLFHAIIHCVS